VKKTLPYRYEIKDPEALRKYFIGKTPRIRDLFYQGLKSSFGTVVGGDYQPYPTLIRHSQKLQKMGAIEKFSYKLEITPFQEESRIKKELRGKIRKKIMGLSVLQLKKILEEIG